jgi:hypothetical protein
VVGPGVTESIEVTGLVAESFGGGGGEVVAEVGNSDLEDDSELGVLDNPSIQ